MSASSKKKLRNEQQAAKLTERQLAEQKEAKKLKIYTITFVIVLVALLVIAVVFGVNNAITNSGIRERKTIALTVGEHKINNAEMNYYFIDSVNSNLSGENAYMVQLGMLDPALPLDEQTNPLTGQNWADYLMEYATQNAKSNYVLVDAANAEGFTLPENMAAEIESMLVNMDMYAALSGYPDGEAYLKAMYGTSADMDSYKQYLETSMLAQAYYNEYSDTLTYEDADLRAAEADNYGKYSSYTYNYYYMAANKFLEGGSTDSEGNTTYTEEETDASIQAAEAAAKALVADCTTVEELDVAIAKLSINEGSETPVSSILYEDTLYTSIANQKVAEWISNSSRKEGDITYIANEISSTDSETGETETTISGYYVIYFHGANDNTFALKNVRHILSAYTGGTSDPTTGAVTYTNEEKAAAKAEAEEILAQWKSGDANEDSFAALANEHSDDGDGTTGGLYEDIYPGQMIAPFEAWCFADGRKAGETDIVETDYGYHVMYFSGESDITFRDYMITNELKATALNDWYMSMMDAATVTPGDTSYVNTGITLNVG